MNARTLAALVLLNAVLLAALIVTSFAPRSAEAQLGGAAANYMMVAGAATGQPQQDVIYVVNTTDGRVLAMSYSSATGELTRIAGRNIARDLQGAGNRR